MTDAKQPHRRDREEQRRRPVHEGHRAVPAMRLFQPRHRHPRPSRRQISRRSTCSRTRRSAHGIKEYSDWPTIPQLYVKGEFVGGSDIMMEMFESGELQQLCSALGLNGPENERKGRRSGTREPLLPPLRWRGTKWTRIQCSNRRANSKKWRIYAKYRIINCRALRRFVRNSDSFGAPPTPPNMCVYNCNRIAYSCSRKAWSMDMRISDAELEVMEVLWAAGQPLTAAEVAERHRRRARLDAGDGQDDAVAARRQGRDHATARTAAAFSIRPRSSAKPMSAGNPAGSSNDCSAAVYRRWSRGSPKRMRSTTRTSPRSRRC